jgi:hypothetical protein
MAKVMTKRRYKEYPASITVRDVTEPVDKAINRYISALNVKEGKELLKGEAILKALQVGLNAELTRLLGVEETRKIV